MSIAQRHVDPTCRAVSGSLCLIETEKPIGEIDLRESQILDITEPQSGIEAEEERPAYNRILVGVMR